MQAETEYGLDQGRHRIIRRPRLTRMLDAATARIVLLSAPAGYGKTLLALEWLEAREHVWFRGTSAIADVAALALSLADAADRLVPGAESRMRERLRASMEPAREVDSLAGLLGDDLDRWPEGAWLAIDDYQFAAGSAASEEFVERLSAHPRLRLLLTSRQRPGWVSARKVLYGEVFELGAHALAMEEDEAAEVFSRSGSKPPPGLVTLVEGWPAVIGLAALTDDFAVPEGALPEGLYDYFAEELYAAASPELQWQLCQLAIAPRVDATLARALFVDQMSTVLAEGVRLGFLHTGERGFEMHPLLRRFLEAKFRERDPAEVAPAVDCIAKFLVRKGKWDDAISLARDFGAADVLVELMTADLDVMLLEGRLPTITRWVDYAQELQVSSPLLGLVSAELARRRGDHTTAQALASYIAGRLPPRHQYVSRLYVIAGQAAMLTSDDHSALEYYTRARRSATTESDIKDSLWGQFLSTGVLEDPRASGFLRELDESLDKDANTHLRLAAARAHLGHRLGDLTGLADLVKAAYPLLPQASDPMIRTAFLNMCAFTLALTGNYQHGLTMAEEEAREADRMRLSFVVPFALVTRSVCDLGLRRFAHVERNLNQVEKFARQSGNTHLATNAGALKGRLFLMLRRFSDAAAVTRVKWQGSPSKAMQGEFLATRSLALACTGETQEAAKLASRATEITRAIEAATLVPWVRAISALQRNSPDAPLLVLEAFGVAERTACVDGLVCAYRAWPEVLSHLTEHPECMDRLRAILSNAGDLRLARKMGLLDGDERGLAVGRLTKRELQVLELLAEGRSNKEIASTLVITESTTKVHVRNVIRKLGVRSRTEAALRAAAETHQATAATDPPLSV